MGHTAVFFRAFFEYSQRIALFLLYTWVIFLSVLYTALAVLRHNQYQSGAFDLGIYDQAIWQYSRLQYPYNTIKERFILGDHLSLTLPLLAPLYWLWNDARSILIFQAIWIAFSAIPIYYLARFRKLSALTSLSMAFLYSLFYGIQFAIFFDFHPIVIGVGLLAWTIYFYESSRKNLYILFLILTLLTQENMGLALAGIGFIYLFEKKHRKTGLWYILGGISISFIEVKLVSLISPSGYEYWPSLNSNPFLLLSKLFDSSDKRLVWLYSFSWFSFIPLFSPGGVLAILMDLGQYFLPSKQFGHMVTPFLHHRAIVSIFLVLATIQVLERFKNQKRIMVVVSMVLVISALAQQYLFHFPLNKLSKPLYWQTESWMNNNDAIIKLIPPDVSVAAAQNLVPHLSHRNQIYLVWPREHEFDTNSPCEKKFCWWLDFSGHPDYLVADLRNDQWATQLLESPENFRSAVVSMEKMGILTREEQLGEIVLFTVNSKL